MSDWISVEEGTPKQGDRVLLAIQHEECLVVGYWGCGEYEACTVNMEVSCCGYCYGGMVERGFRSEEVTHWMPLPDPPNTLA